MRKNQWTPILLATLCAAASGQETERIVTDQGFELNGDTVRPSISTDGRYVAFSTQATNLGTADANANFDVFITDRATGSIRVVSHAGGSTAAGYSDYPSLSASGRKVAFTSFASDLVPNDTNAASDVFVADLDAGSIDRVSVSTSGVEALGASDSPHLSATGRYVVFISDAGNLVVPADVNGVRDVYLHDRNTGTTELISVTTGGSQINGLCSWPQVSANGRFVVFASSASNVVLGDTNNSFDLFLRDRTLNTTVRISENNGVELNGNSGLPQISDNGRHVAFRTYASNIALVDNNSYLDVFSLDLQTGSLTLISFDKDSPNSTSSGGAGFLNMSRNGRFVTFTTSGADIVNGDTNASNDVFRWDRVTGQRVRMSLAQNGAEGSGMCVHSTVSDDGQVAFGSDAADFVPGDSGLYSDVFVRNLGPDFPELYCSGKQNSQGCVPFLSFEGVASASSTAPFSIQGRDFLPGESGFLIYGVNGKSNLDFHGGKLCVKLPFSRWLPFKQAVKKGTGTCGGVLKRNFNARIQAGVDPQLTAGQVVDAQWLQRDPGDPAGFGDSLSSGIRFTIGA